MTTQLFLLPALYFFVADADHLAVRADAATASVAIQPEGRRLMQLPDLEYRLQISKHCARGRNAASVSISVADTRTTLSGELLTPGAEIEASLLVAAGQLAPLALRSFCVTGEDAERVMLVPSVLTANASLRCANDESESIVYASTALDVAIRCTPEAEGTAP